MIFAKKQPLHERRKYVRLDSVFPVQFRLYAQDGTSPLSDWMQGYTHNIGKGGILLDFHELAADLLLLLKTKQAKVSLKIEMPLNRPAAKAMACVAWMQEKAQESDKYRLGLLYEQIDPLHSIRIMRHAIAKKLFAPAALIILFVLAVAVGANTYINIKLTEGNKALVAQLIEILRESTSAKQKIKDISRDKEDAQRSIQALQVRIQALEEERISGEAAAQAAQKAKVNELNDLIDRLTKEKAGFQDELIRLQQKENVVTEELLRLDQKKADLEKANFDKMYRWLSIHQNLRTGLVMSYEGDKDLSDLAFIYDQSLAVHAYVNFADLDRAKKILEFFARRAKRSDGLFLNAYYASDGSPAEYTVHSGPNIWLGIAALRYGTKSRDQRYRGMAEEIAAGIMKIQAQDGEGGIKGGPSAGWYSTEHNLDAYAFFNMLYRSTGKELYRQSREKILEWLKSHSYDRPEMPIKRGKGDSTIATDTYAWSIAAIGPEKLDELGMNPDKILEFAHENCAVEVDYVSAAGRAVKVKGFDFAPQRNLSRGSVVSTEWTAQMIIAYRILADYYRSKDISAKALAYEKTADDYLSSLCNMIISSPSPTGQGEGCLPYASADSVDTGHGWTAPKGRTTGSVAGTAYTIFAYYNYNPLNPKD
jgi:hypothetical protein